MGDGQEVPDRLLITRGIRVQNLFNYSEYSTRKQQIKAELAAGGADMMRRIDNLKTAGVLPDEDFFRLDDGANEAFLFHGTNDAAAEGITSGDFLVNMAGSNAGTLYGKGVYL